MKNQMFVLLTVLFISLLLFPGCPDDGVQPPSKPDFTLTVEDVVSIEAVIKIQYASSDSITLQLKRNGQTIAQNLRLQKEFFFNDTLLEPKQIYSYTAYKIVNGKIADSTSPLQITTMDTTSSEFAWDTFYFVNVGTSSFYDVTVINDTLIYAVGEIYIKDSSGLDYTVYNAVKWDGETWEAMLVPTESFGGSLGFYQLNTIFSISKNNIWTFSEAGSYSHWDGNTWTTKYLTARSGGGLKLWGIDSVIYLVGNNGSISNFNDNTWKKIESGTTSSIYDVWGVINPTTNKEEVFCASSADLTPGKLLKITNAMQVDSVAWGTGRSLYTVWTVNGKTLYAAGGGLWKNNTGTWKEIDLNSRSAMLRIRGNGNNDIFVAGVFGLAAHFNGKQWRSYNELSNASYSSVSIKDDVIALSGEPGTNQAILTIGRRK